MFDYERAVLGAVLVSEGNWTTVAVLRATDFSLDSHRRIYSRMVELADASRPIDILTLIEELRSHGELEAVGEERYVSDLISGLPDRPLSDLEDYVLQIKRAANRRKTRTSLERAQRLVDDPQVSNAALAQFGQHLIDLAEGGEQRPSKFSEEALALRFSSAYGNDWRYVSAWGRWMFWDGKRWIHDDTLRVFDLSRGIARAASVECIDRKTAVRLASKTTTAAIEGLARADRRHSATTNQWDTNPLLLNTPSGTVNLLTGELRAHRREDHITKMTAAGPTGDCPQWLKFIDRITGGDLELQSFLQRMIGYCLTGSTQDHAFFFLYGTGANGKSVFLSTITGVLRDYAKIAPVSTFAANSTEQHPTDLARLRGARLVTAIEVEDGTRLAESKIKSLTGGDKIAARFMRQDFFEFQPECKLVIAGNHKPGLRSVDEAFRRRIILVPFTITIPENDRDPMLSHKLQAEFSGILNWAVRGCLDWQGRGLDLPLAVRQATANYLAAEDTLGQWLEDRCNLDPKVSEHSAILFADWCMWCNANGEKSHSPKRFGQQLEARGCKPVRTSRARGFSGIGLKRNQ